MSDRYVYAFDYEDGRPAYIGVGKGDRLNQHLRDAKFGAGKTGNPSKFNFLVECLARGYLPTPYKIAEGLTIAEANEYEKVLIVWYGRVDLGTGCLLNACAGGFGIKNYSANTRAKISERTRAAMAGTEFRKHLSKKARQRPEDSKAKASENTRKQFATSGHPRIGKKHSAETKAKIVETTYRQFAASGHPRVGLKHSTATSEKMKASAAKFWSSPEARERQAERMRGKKLSDETRAKMSASHRKRFTSEVVA